jgi:hypothetical protein
VVLLPNITPMPLRRRPRPFDSRDWLFEIKYDGFRAPAQFRGGSVITGDKGTITSDKGSPEVLARFQIRGKQAMSWRKAALALAGGIGNEQTPFRNGRLACLVIHHAAM